MVSPLNENQRTSLEYAASDVGGWPRAKANERSWIIRSYRALERRGLVREVLADQQVVGGHLRLHFVATDAGRELLETILKDEDAKAKEPSAEAFDKWFNSRFIELFAAQPLSRGVLAREAFEAGYLAQAERIAVAETNRDAARDNFLTMQNAANTLRQRAEAAEAEVRTLREAPLEWDEAMALAMAAVHDGDGRGMIGQGRRHLEERVARALMRRDIALAALRAKEP